MMFQSYALFPHLDVFDNIAFGLRRQGASRDAIFARVAELLDIVQLQNLGARKIDQLSGGQKQRVALARALAPGPDVAAARRAPRRPRPQAARGDAISAERHPAATKNQLPDRHP